MESVLDPRETHIDLPFMAMQGRAATPWGMLIPAYLKNTYSAIKKAILE